MEEDDQLEQYIELCKQIYLRMEADGTLDKLCMEEADGQQSDTIEKEKGTTRHTEEEIADDTQQ